jgi:hypothetical protein
MAAARRAAEYADLTHRAVMCGLSDISAGIDDAMKV